MLEVRNLRFAYFDREVLRGISFGLKRGVGCLLGPNGAGKSTLIKCIAGVLRPSGKVLLGGEELLSLDLTLRARLVSYAPQEFNTAFPYSVFEVVLMGRNPHVNPLTGPTEEDEEIVWKSLELLGLTGFADRPFMSLSGGQKRLVIIARAIAQGGRLLLLDEPTSFLDFKNQHIILSTVRKLAEKLGRLILISLHDPNQALTFCDRVFLMQHGELLAEGPAHMVLTEENISRLYGMEVRVIEVEDVRLILPREEHEKGSCLRFSDQGWDD